MILSAYSAFGQLLTLCHRACPRCSMSIPFVPMSLDGGILFYEAHSWTRRTHLDSRSDFVLSNPNHVGLESY